MLKNRHRSLTCKLNHNKNINYYIGILGAYNNYGSNHTLSGLSERLDSAVIPERVCDKFAQFSGTAVQAAGKESKNFWPVQSIVMTEQAYWTVCTI